MREVTLPSKQEYAKLWGAKLVDWHISASDDLCWHRPLMWLGHLESLPVNGAMWFLGCDTLIMNQNINWIDVAQDNDMVIGLDVNGINTDSFFLRHRPESVAMLKRVIELKGSERNEQDAMNRALGEIICDVKIVPQRYLNSYSYSVLMNRSADKGGDFRLGDFVLHAPGGGVPYEKRVAFLREMSSKIIR